MSHYARFLTHADRAQRRGQIKRALAAGKSCSEVAEQFGLTCRYIKQIAQDAGLSRAQGRPKGSRWWSDCPQHLLADYDYLTRRKRIPVAEIKRILEAA
jgi:hypothetical protein